MVDNDGDLVFEDAPGESPEMDGDSEQGDLLFSFGEDSEDGTETDPEEEKDQKTVPYRKLESVSRTNQALKAQIESLEKQVSEMRQQPDYSAQLKDVGFDSVEDALKAFAEDKRYLDVIEAHKSNPAVAQAINFIKENAKMDTPKSNQKTSQEDPRIEALMQDIQMGKRQNLESMVDDLTKNWTPVARKAMKPAVAREFDYGQPVNKETAKAAIREFCKQNGISQKDVLLPETAKKKVSTAPGKGSARPVTPSPKVKKDEKPKEPRFRSQRAWADHAKQSLLEGLEEQENADS